jgi:hypothetical protein
MSVLFAPKFNRVDFYSIVLCGVFIHAGFSPWWVVPAVLVALVVSCVGQEVLEARP